jgi:hypothetical protein
VRVVLDNLSTHSRGALYETFTAPEAHRILRQGGGSLLLTPSRRTGETRLALLRAKLANLPAVIWDGSGENPYFAYLAFADALLAFPSSDLGNETITIWDAPIQALAAQHADLDLDHVEPAGVLGGVVTPRRPESDQRRRFFPSIKKAARKPKCPNLNRDG